ncbi:MAG: hypothetical protein V4620_07930 [Bacteroidota bacterium]
MKVFLLIILTMLLFACKHDAMKNVVIEKPLPNDSLMCDTAMVTYSITIKNVLAENCLRCHGGSVYTTKGSGYNLEDYTVLKAEVDNGHVAKAINHSPGAVPMPLGQTQKMSDCNIRKIMIWIANGVPQN